MITTSHKRILFFAEAVTLAHIARCVALADELHNTGNYTIALAADNRYDEILGEIPYQRIPLYSVPNEYFLKKLAKGTPLYNVKTLCSYVEEDIKVIETFKPDFIFGDFRLSLAISGKIKKIPYATITNAYWSPYANITYPIPEIPLTKIFGVAIAQKLFDLVKPLIFKIHALAFNKTCKKFGLPPLPYDMRETYTHADYTLYADIESLIPMKRLPGNHLFIGPILWSAKVSLPDWWKTLPTDKPIVFITLGSSGDSKLLPMIIDALSKMPVTVICVTAKKKLVSQVYSNVFVAEFLPVKDAVKKADVIICNGGSPMVYQSLVENKSVIGIPGNLDQYLMMSLLKAANKGQLIRAGKADAKAVHNAVNKALSERENTNNPASSVPPFSIKKIEELIQLSTK
jgi:UDP:flavonoid glycosyltransferase YjiC (YdhE family)